MTDFTISNITTHSFSLILNSRLYSHSSTTQTLITTNDTIKL